MVSTFSTDTKICGNCGQEKPLGEFRRRRRDSDSREARCRCCYNRYMRRWRARRRGKVLDRFAGELGRERSLSRAAALCGRMVSDFGGIGRFARLWKSHIDHAASVQPGSPSVLRSLGAVVKLVEVASARQKPDCSTWTDEDLEREFQRLLAGR